MSRRTSVVLIAVIVAGALACVPGLSSAQGNAGIRVQTIPFEGRQRTFRVYTPRLESGKSLSLVFILHGGGGTGEQMERLTQGGFNRLADREGFIAVYPDGVERHWNDGRGVQQYQAHRENVDDVGFLSAVIDHVGRSVTVDRGRVFSTGISNGGLMSFRLARELSTRIAAIAPVAISMSEEVARMQQPARPVAVIMIPGTLDPLVPWNGGDLGFQRGAKVGRVLSVSETIRYWTGHNHCAGTPAVAMEPDRDPSDGTRVRREVYGSCREDADVALYAVEGGGHTWPGGRQYLPVGIVGRTSRDIDANEVIWAFFKSRSIK